MMKKAIIFTLAAVALLVGVSFADAQPAEACQTHGLVHAATLADLYSDIPGMTFNFGHHHYTVTTPGGFTQVFNSWYESGLNSAIGVIEGVLQGELDANPEFEEVFELQESFSEEGKDFSG